VKATIRADAPAIVEGGSATSPLGFAAGAVYAGIKAHGEGKLDVGILASDRPCTAAAMFTRSTVKGAPVIVSQQHVADGNARAIIVNSGVSNVANGAQGIGDAEEMCGLAATKLGVQPSEILVGSTGVIGRPLPMHLIRDAVSNIELSVAGGHDFARAIMTTDTHPKTLAVRFHADSRDYTIGAVAKGSGMIHPDMATMFCFLTTDAPVGLSFLRSALQRAVDSSLNMISVDGDTSTSDTTAMFANGAAGGDRLTSAHAAAPAFESALLELCTSVAKTLARDGEGATKLIEVRIEGGASLTEARAAARTITSSPLVKTAVHGADPNWGRVLMAIGRSGAAINLDHARVWLGATQVYSGLPAPYDDRSVSEYLANEHVVIRADLASGDSIATAWGCDMSADYVEINSDYTT
jgi:glutamate N-acetyltransferase/amino-acid N-acetyltransferase